MKKLPIGIQTFRIIREENYYYVDKTNDAYELINTYKYTFLACPRRFGKSLFLDTLKEIFEGNKKLFEGLYIYNKWKWDEKFPVIKISFSGNRSLQELINDIYKNIKQNEERLDVKENEGCKALKQIKERRYYEKYQNQNKEIYLIGICFSEKEKNIVKTEYEKIG